jgi:cytochrome c oxidase cbb3-type subunit 3
MKRDEAPMMDHEADGIRELDNLLPRWWVWLFNLSIVFAVVYMAFYHVLSLGDSQKQAYEKEEKHGAQIKSAAMAKFESSLEELKPLPEKARLAQGQQTFLVYCAPCHRNDGGGLVGPNLCDDFWLHGSNFVDTVKTIVNGVPEKGMLTWRGVLKPNEIINVATYIYTLRGTIPPNPKPPENQQQPASNKPSEFE